MANTETEWERFLKDRLKDGDAMKPEYDACRCCGVPTLPVEYRARDGEYTVHVCPKCGKIDWC